MVNQNNVVSMRFDTSNFIAGVQTAMAGLDRLRNALALTDGRRGLEGVDEAARRMNFGNLGTTVEGINGKLLAMSTIAVTALSRITNAAITTGIQLTKSLTIQPAIDGLKEYETNINSIQTILANTQVSGKNLQDVNKALEELNHYSDKTIYNFSDMTRNIGTFTAAGVDLDTSVNAIKGIANLAAMSGSNAQQASSAMYQLSQALASGKVSLQDWNSVVNAGMGGTTFQRALAQTAVAMGKLPKEALTLDGAMKNVKISGESFRDSIEAKPGRESWLTKDVLTNTLSQFTGDLSEAQIKAQGFNDQQTKDIMKMADTAMRAATEVKTLSGVIDTAKEVSGSGWAKTWQLIFGDFEQAKTMFTQLSNYVNGFIDMIADDRNKQLEKWADLGGRAKMIEGLTTAFKALLGPVVAIAKGFGDVFGHISGEELYAATEAFVNFANTLTMTPETLDKVRNIAAGVASVFALVRDVVREVASRLFNFATDLAGNSGGVLDYAENVAIAVSNFQAWVEKTDAISRALDSAGGYLSSFGRYVSDVAFWLGQVARAISEGSLEPIIDMFIRVGGEAKTFAEKSELASKAIDGVKAAIDRLAPIFEPLIQAIARATGNFITTISEAIKGANLQDFVEVFQTLIGGTLVVAIKDFMQTGSEFGGIFESVNGAFDQLTGTLKTMQNQVQADTIMKIAKAVALLVVSVVALSMIDSEKLKVSLTALSVAFAQMLAAMAVLVKIGGMAGLATLPVMAGAMILFAGAVAVLAGSVIAMGQLDWEQLKVGLTGLAGVLVGMILISQGLAGASKSLIIVGAAMIPLATGIRIMASAVTAMAGLSWEQLAVGLAGLAGGLAIIAGAMWLMPPQMLVQAASLVAVGIALKLMASSMQVFADMPWENLGRGMVGLAGGLAIITAALWLMPPQMIVQAAALVVVAAAIKSLAKSFEILGNFTKDNILASISMLAMGLGVLAAAMYLMSGSLPGAAAMVVVAGALAIMVPPLILLGTMSWGGIAKGLTMLAGTLAILGGAAALLGPLVPVILGLGAGMVLFGAGMALAGAGAFLFASAIGIFTAACTAAVGSATALVMAAPLLGVSLATSVVSFGTTLAQNAATFTNAIKELVLALLQAVIEIAPPLGRAVNALIPVILDVLVQNIPKIVIAGIQLFMGLVDGLTQNMEPLAESAVKLIETFAATMDEKMPRMTQAAYDLVITFMNSLSDSIEKNSARFEAASRRLGRAIIDGVVGAVNAGSGDVLNALIGVAKGSLQGFKDVLGIHSPSRRFYEIGEYMMMGLGNAIRDTSTGIYDQFETVAETVTERFNPELGISEKLTFGFGKLNPTITPVMDLSNIDRGAREMKYLLAQSARVEAMKDTARAQDIQAYEASKTVETAKNANTEPAKIEFNQYNTSPKELSPVEIYRNTRSQIALAKEALINGR